VSVDALWHAAPTGNAFSVSVPNSGEGGSKFDEHPAPVVCGRHDQHGVGCNTSGLHHLHVLGVRERPCHIDLYVVRIAQATDSGAEC